MIALTLLAALAVSPADAEPQAAAPVAAEPAATTPQAAASQAARATDLVGRSPISLRVQGGLAFPTTLDRSGCESRFPEQSQMGPVLNVAAGYRVHPNLAVELATGLSWYDGAATSRGKDYWIDCAKFRVARVPLTLGLRAGASDPEGRIWAGVTVGTGAYLSRVDEDFVSDLPSGTVFVRGEETLLAFGGYAGFSAEFRVDHATRLGLEVRVTHTTKSPQYVEFDGDGPQLLIGLTHQFGAPKPPPGEAARWAPLVKRPVDPRRWRVHARMGGFFPRGGDLSGMGAGLEGEIGVARLLAPGAAVEAAVGYFGARTSVEGASLPEVNVFPLTVGMRGIASVGERLEASAFGGLGLYLVDYRATPSLGERAVAPGAYLGAGLAAKVWRSAYLGMDGRLIVARATLGGAFEYSDPELDLAGLRVGATVTVPF